MDKLIDSRLLVQSGAGGGKSWFLRRLLEQSHGKIQQIVLDIEGEFNTLREKYDYLLLGEGGDAPISVKTAELLAYKILESGVSTIIDLYEMKQHDRILFMKRFCDALINAPKKLWHPCLIVIDEAHIFCPEKGKAESANAVIELCTRGRKRGFCACIATQRLSKLHKDAAAECFNKYLGKTGLDIDRKRVAEELGITDKQEILKLRNLKPGNFYGFGPAISDEVNLVNIGIVNTTHPKRGERIIKESTPPTEKIKSLLKKLSDLPQEAEKQLKTTQDLKQEIYNLKVELRRKPTNIDDKTINFHFAQGFNEAQKQSQKSMREAEQQFNQQQSLLEKMHTLLSTHLERKLRIPQEQKHIPLPLPQREIFIPKEEVIPHASQENILSLAEKKIYTLLYQYPEKVFSKAQIGVFTGYSHTSGGFNNALSRLNKLQLIQRQGNSIQLKQSDPDAIGEFDFSKEAIIGKLGKCEREIYTVLLAQPHTEFLKEDLAAQTTTTYSATSGGFNNALSRLNTLGILTRSNNKITLNPELLEIG